MFALFTASAVRRQKRHFPQHLYLALHTHAAWFGIFSLVEVARFAHVPAVSTGAAIGAAIAIVVYTTLAVRTVYGRSWLRAGLQSVITLFGSGPAGHRDDRAVHRAVRHGSLKKKKGGPFGGPP